MVKQQPGLRPRPRGHVMCPNNSTRAGRPVPVTSWVDRVVRRCATGRNGVFMMHERGRLVSEWAGKWKAHVLLRAGRGHVSLILTRPTQRLSHWSLCQFNQAVHGLPPFCSHWDSSSPGAALSLWEHSGCPLPPSLLPYLVPVKLRAAFFLCLRTLEQSHLCLHSVFWSMNSPEPWQTNYLVRSWN